VLPLPPALGALLPALGAAVPIRVVELGELPPLVPLGALPAEPTPASKWHQKQACMLKMSSSIEQMSGEVLYHNCQGAEVSKL
jgi:hypothetical protein